MVVGEKVLEGDFLVGKRVIYAHVAARRNGGDGFCVNIAVRFRGYKNREIGLAFLQLVLVVGRDLGGDDLHGRRDLAQLGHEPG